MLPMSMCNARLSSEEIVVEASALVNQLVKAGKFSGGDEPLMIRLSQLVINVWSCSGQGNARFEALSKVCTIVADHLREPIEMALQQHAGGLRPKARVFATALLISSGIDAPCPREHVLDACETASSQLSACPSDSSRCMMVHLLVQAMVRHRGAIEILREGTDEVQGLISSLLMSIPLASKAAADERDASGLSMCMDTIAILIRWGVAQVAPEMGTWAEAVRTALRLSNPQNGSPDSCRAAADLAAVALGAHEQAWPGMEVGREQVQAWWDTIGGAACQCGAGGGGGGGGGGGERFDDRSMEGGITLALAMSTVGLFAATRSSSSRVDAANFSAEAVGRLQSAACMRDCVCVPREHSLLFHANVLLLDFSSTPGSDDGHYAQCDRGVDLPMMPASARFLAEELERFAGRASGLAREHGGCGDATGARDALAAELARAATGGGITCPLLVARLIACAMVLSGGNLCANSWHAEPLHCAIAHDALERAFRSQGQSMEGIGTRFGGGVGEACRGGDGDDAVVKAVQDLVREMRGQRAKHAGEIAALEAEHIAVQDALSSQLSAVQARKIDADKKVCAAEERAATAEKRLASLKDEVSSLKDDADDLREQLQESVGKQRGLKAELEEAEEKMLCKDERIRDLEHKLSLLAAAHKDQACKLSKQSEQLKASKSIHSAIQKLCGTAVIEASCLDTP